MCQNEWCILCWTGNLVSKKRGGVLINRRGWGELKNSAKRDNTVCIPQLKNFEPCSVNIFQVFLRKSEKSIIGGPIKALKKRTPRLFGPLLSKPFCWPCNNYKKTWLNYIRILSRWYSPVKIFTWRKIISRLWDLTCVEVKSQLNGMNFFSYWRFVFTKSNSPFCCDPTGEIPH